MGKLILIIVGLLIAVGIIWYSGNAIVDLSSSLLGKPTNSQLPSASTPPTVPGEPNLVIEQTETYKEQIDTETIPLNNCGNPKEFTAQEQRKRIIEHKTEVGGDASANFAMPANLLSLLTFELNGHYGVENSLKEEQTFTINVPVSPYSKVNYKINWKYVWQQGKVTVSYKDGTILSFPYKIRTKLAFELGGVEVQDCTESVITPTITTPTN